MSTESLEGGGYFHRDSANAANKPETTIRGALTWRTVKAPLPKRPALAAPMGTAPESESPEVMEVVAESAADEVVASAALLYRTSALVLL